MWITPLRGINVKMICWFTAHGSNNDRFSLIVNKSTLNVFADLLIIYGW